MPISAAVSANAYGFDQTTPLPTFEDRNACRFEFQLTGEVSAHALAKLIQRDGEGPWEVDDLNLELPGAKVRAPHARIEHQGKAILIEFLPRIDTDETGREVSEER